MQGQSPCIRRTELVTPQPVRFTADLNTPVREQPFYITVTEIEAVEQPYCVLNDVGRKSMTFIRVSEGVHSPIVGQPLLTWQYRPPTVSGRRGVPRRLDAERAGA